MTLTSAKKIIALVPAYNEEEKIADTISGLQEIDKLDEIVVIDDASTDKTAQIAKSGKARVISLKSNTGKGGAVRKALSQIEGDILLLVDADIGLTAKNAGVLISTLEEKKADMVIAILPPSKKSGGVGLARKFATWCIKQKTGVLMKAPLSGQRAILSKSLEENFIKDEYGFEVGLTIAFLKNKKKVIEIPVNLEHVGTGRDIMGFIHRGNQLIDIFKVWLRG